MITLEPHPAHSLNRATGQIENDVPHARQVMIDGRRVGYVNTEPGGPLSIIDPTLTEAERQAVIDFVAEQLGRVPPKVGIVPAMTDAGGEL